MKRLTLILVGIYLAVVLFFAVCYRIAWHVNPDAFVVNSEFNIFPADELWGWLTLGPVGSPVTVPDTPFRTTDAADSRAKIAALVTQLGRAQDSAARLQAELLGLDTQLKPQHDELMRAWQTNVDAHRTRELAPLQATKSEMAQVVAEFEANLASETDAIVRLEIVRELGDARIALADADVRLAQKAYEVSASVLNEIRRFHDEELLAKTTAIDEQIRECRRELSKCWDDQGNLRQEGWRVYSEYYKAKQGRLGFLEFCYFSLGVSTTTTFGDLIPNTRGVRALTTLQLVACTLLVGLIIAYLANPSKRKQQQTASKR